jgi:hypothetical protein
MSSKVLSLSVQLLIKTRSNEMEKIVVGKAHSVQQPWPVITRSQKGSSAKAKNH